MKIGRNDPCPCGSGIKYKKCCAGKQQSGEGPAGVKETMDELRKALEGETFNSMEEANAFIGRHMQQRNKAPIEEFCGLSSEQMHLILDFPFDTPELVSFPSRLDVAPEAPIMTLFTLLAEGIGTEGLKATATGNLPRNFCREAALSFWGEEKYREKTRYGGINKEMDFRQMHLVRVIAELAGLVRKYKGRFILGQDCRKLFTKDGSAGIYPLLFRAAAREYNWGYQDLYPDYPIIQQSVLFTLILLHRFGDQWRDCSFYTDRFIRAFPSLLDEPQHYSFETAENTVRGCYSLRALDRFAEFLGLVEIERPPEDVFRQDFRLRKLPLLDHMVRFHL